MTKTTKTLDDNGLADLMYIPYITFNNTKAVDSRGIYGFYKEGQQGQFSATHLQVGHKTCPCRP